MVMRKLIIGLSVMAAFFAFVQKTEAYREDVLIEDYQINCTMSVNSDQKYRVLFRVRNNTTKAYMRIFPADRLLQYKMLSLDFEDLSFTESDSKGQSIQKVFDKTRYIEALCFCFNASYTVSDMLKASFGSNAIVGFLIQYGGIEFFADTPVPNETFSLDNFDSANLFETERELYDRTVRYINNNK